SSISQPYKEALWKVLSRLSPKQEKISKSNLTILIPRLSYQACDGRIAFPIEISAAWYLFYLAADLMDSVQDRDHLPLLQEDHRSSAELLGYASGFFFLANALLASLLDREYNLETTKSVIKIFQNKLLVMCEGQQEDLSLREVGLKEYLDLAHKKSGNFFSLACLAGASMANADSICLERLSAFGTHLGCIIQILDDLEDWHRIESGDKTVLKMMDWYKNLPTVYALEVLPWNEKTSFRNVIEKLSIQPEYWQDYVAWVNRTGAAVYIMTALTQEVELARNALKSDRFLQTPREALLRIINRLVGEE
ncbi:MAG: polyprenyl synthetase family protein, partial [Anaerolineales bacterium]|nr:polyprenyl synthetase family protein [Anaerolineales bacterium]